ESQRPSGAVVGLGRGELHVATLGVDRFIAVDDRGGVGTRHDGRPYRRVVGDLEEVVGQRIGRVGRARCAGPLDPVDLLDGAQVPLNPGVVVVGVRTVETRGPLRAGVA